MLCFLNSIHPQKNITQARESRSNNCDRRSKLSDNLRESSGKNLDTDAYNLESGGNRTYADGAEKETDERSSVPLLIVGNKIDKLNAHEKLALQNACPQQIFVVNCDMIFFTKFDLWCITQKYF